MKRQINNNIVVIEETDGGYNYTVTDISTRNQHKGFCYTKNGAISWSRKIARGEWEYAKV